MCYILHSCTSGATSLPICHFPLKSTSIAPDPISSGCDFATALPPECEKFFLFELNAKPPTKSDRQAHPGQSKKNAGAGQILRGFETITKSKAPRSVVAQ